MKHKIYHLILILILSFSVKGQEYQWSVPVRGYLSDETNANPEAFLWIPPNCRQIRGLVIGQHNMCEETIFDHVMFRRTMDELNFAIVWISPGFEQKWDVQNGCQSTLDDVINELAESSGYRELKNVPIVPLGHSAMATFPWNFAAWNPDRTLAVISYHGDAPRTNLTGYGKENIEWGRNRNIDGIPGLMIEGEYEWWQARVNPALAFRMMYPKSCISFLCDVGRGHFDVSDQVVGYICLFLRKAAHYRLPRVLEFDMFPVLKRLNPVEGWLAERWSPNQEERTPAAPYTVYKGNCHEAFWYYDKEMADATENYYKNANSKRLQYIGFTFDKKLLTYDAVSHANYKMDFNRMDLEGVTYKLSAAFTDSSRNSFSKEHAKGKIRIDRICGPMKKVNDSTFEIQFYRMGMNNFKRTNEVWLVASQEGDEVFKSAVQQINIKLDYPLISGKRQFILFPGLPDLKKGENSLRLAAFSDADLPVSYYVKAGPAEIYGNQLKLTAIPPRAKYPIKVSVIAWQYGLKGRVQSAAPVERSFFVFQ